MKSIVKILSFGLFVLCSLVSFQAQALNASNPTKLQNSKHHSATSVKFSVVNANGEKIAPSFRVPVKKSNGIIAFPLFNFTLPADGYLVAKPKGVDTRGSQSYLLSCNDAYLTPFTIDNIPTTLPIKGFALNISKNGKWQISNYSSTSSSTAISAGDHTINAQSISTRNSDLSGKATTHVFQQLLLDCNYFQLPGTQFNVSSVVRDHGSLVSITVDSFTFTTSSAIGPNDFNGAPIFNPGGYLTTLGNALPDHLRPGQTQTLAIDQGALSLNVSIDTYGRLTVAAGNYFAQTLPIGTYTVPEMTFQYFKLDQNLYSDKWVKNFIIQQELTNLTLNDLPERDSHVNDFHDGQFVSSWYSNADLPASDLTAPLDNVFFAKYELVNGEMKCVIPAKNVTNFVTAPAVIFDSAVSINRTDKNNIVISFGLQTHGLDGLYVCVSTDGGYTFSDPIVVYAKRSPFDARGVTTDKYGNFFCSANFSDTYPTNSALNLHFYASSDQGFTWNLIYETDFTASIVTGYDYPQIFVGNNGIGGYGLNYFSNFYPVAFTADNYGQLGFIPVTGLGQYGTTEQVQVTQYPNLLTGSQPTVSKNGTVFLTGFWGENDFFVNQWNGNLAIKRPGPLDPALVDTNRTVVNVSNNDGICNSIINSSYFSQAVQGSFYDDKRHALYVVYSEQPYETNQDFYQFLVVSLDEGVTWSDRIPVASSHLNNRGFCSMWLDSKTGGLAFSWDDGRNDPTTTSTQFFGGFISPKKLDKLVKKLKH